MDEFYDTMYGVEHQPKDIAKPAKPLLEIKAKDTAKTTSVQLGEETLVLPNTAYLTSIEGKVDRLQERLSRLERVFTQMRRLTEAQNRLVREIGALRADIDNKVDRHE